MTRARQVLHLYVKPRGQKINGELRKLSKSLASVVREALCDLAVEENPLGGEVLYEAGTSGWAGAKGEVREAVERSEVLHLSLPKKGEQPRRSWLAIHPSGLEGGGRVRGTDLLNLQGAAARERGSLVHNWLEMVGFVDEPASLPDDEALLDAAQQRMPEISRMQAQAELASLHETLAKPAVCGALSRNGADALWVERQFVIRRTGKLMRGTFDRVAVHHDAQGKPNGATLIDFKTDRLADAAVRDEAVQRYIPQLQAYRGVLAQVLGIQEPAITTRLIFLESGDVMDVALDEVEQAAAQDLCKR